MIILAHALLTIGAAMTIGAAIVAHRITKETRK